MNAHLELPLKSHTPDRWATEVLREPLALLSDHAYLEKKAANNALELLNRWPDPEPPRSWITTLANVARDEAAHLAVVCRLLARRGGRLEKMHKNQYAQDLHRLVRKGQGTRELLDRLLIAALIETRSCERFGVLARVSTDADFVKLYQGLWSSELRHYQVFVRLAGRILPAQQVDERWQALLEAEADILAGQPPGPRIHSR